jgi:hypothetical protein
MPMYSSVYGEKFTLLAHLKGHGNENDEFLRKLFLIGPLHANL